MNDDPSKEEYRLLLKLQCKRKRLGLFRKKIVQGIPYHIDVIVNNMGPDFPGGAILNFYIEYKTSKLGEKYQNSKPILALKTGKSAKVRIGNFMPLYQGPVWFQCSIQANDHLNVRVHHEGGAKIEAPNGWGDANFIEGKIETLQARTNYLILLLTALIFLDGTLGLKDIFQYAMQLIHLG